MSTATFMGCGRDSRSACSLQNIVCSVGSLKSIALIKSNLWTYLTKPEEIAMKDKHSLHLKVQELCDCFATADPLKEMSLLEKDDDRTEAALK